MKNNFEFTVEEQQYLKEIHHILKSSEYPNLFYVVGYDKTTGQRKIFLFHTEIKDGIEYTYALAEILNDGNSPVDDVEFQFTTTTKTNYQYGPKKPWWKFWGV